MHACACCVCDMNKAHGHCDCCEAMRACVGGVCVWSHGQCDCCEAMQACACLCVLVHEAHGHCDCCDACMCVLFVCS
jgi:hypothetical protein